MEIQSTGNLKHYIIVYMLVVLSIMFIILINFENHLKLIINTNKINNSNDIIEAYNKGIKILRQLSLSFSFSYNKKFGYLTSNISFLGSGFRIHSEIEMKNINNYKNYIKKFKFILFFDKG